MRTTSHSEFRKNLASNLDRVNDDCEPVLITRDRGKPAAVLMSLEEYASSEETMYLLRSPKNAAGLARIHRRTGSRQRRPSGSCLSEDPLHRARLGGLSSSGKTIDQQMSKRLNALIKEPPHAI